MKDHPQAGAVIAIAEIGERADVWARAVDCRPMHLIVIAELLLERAATEMAAAVGRDKEFLPHLKSVEAARAALNIYEEKPQA